MGLLKEVLVDRTFFGQVGVMQTLDNTLHHNGGGSMCTYCT